MFRLLLLLSLFMPIAAMQNDTIELRKTKRSRPSMIIRMKVRFRSKNLDIAPGTLKRSPALTCEEWAEKHKFVVIKIDK